MTTATHGYRRLLIILLLSVALVACGKEEEIPTAQEDAARAERVVLHESDLPGFTRDDGDDEDESDPADEAFEECAEGTSLSTSGEADERGAESSFTNDDDDSIQVLSGVSFFETEKEAEAAFAPLTAPEFAPCLENAFRTVFGDVSDQATVTVSVSEVPTEESADEHVGYRVVVSAFGPGGARTGYLDFIFLRVGRGAATIGAFQVAEPFDNDERNRLSEIVTDRLRG